MLIDCGSDLHYVLKVDIGKRNGRTLARLPWLGFRRHILFGVPGMFVTHLDISIQPTGCLKLSLFSLSKKINMIGYDA
jgi:hypothetical protein